MVIRIIEIRVIATNGVKVRGASGKLSCWLLRLMKRRLRCPLNK